MTTKLTSAIMSAMIDPPISFEENVNFKGPAGTIAMVKKVAAALNISASDFYRRAIFKELKRLHDELEHEEATTRRAA